MTTARTPADAVSDRVPDAAPDRAPAPVSDRAPDAAPAPAADGFADAARLTGKRRVAFACFATEPELPGLAVLLRSLALSNPALCEDFVLVRPELPEERIAPLRRLHPRLVERHGSSRADLLRTTGYDTLIALTPGMLVRGDLSPLLRINTGTAAVLQPVGPHPDQLAPDPDGLLVLQTADAQRVGSLAELAADADQLLGAAHDFPVRRLHGDMPLPEPSDARVLRLHPEHRPWEGPRPGYGPVETAWAAHELDDETFRARWCELRAPQHPDLFRHFAPSVLASRPTVDLAHRLGTVHLAAGEYEEAVEVLAAAGARANQPRFHETLGRALSALSRYDEARTHFLLAAADPEVAPRAFGRLAKLARIRGGAADAQEYARQGLAVDPTHRECRVQLHPEPFQLDAKKFRPDPAPSPGEQFAHVALYATGQENAGDKVLPEAVRRSLEPKEPGPARWHGIDAHRLFDEDALAAVNARRGLVIGGGGLFLPDTVPNGHSGWQWNVPDELLRRIEVPVAVFAVGYNVFDGQSYRRERFLRSLRTLVERADFVGLRNHGSVERVRALLPEELRERVGYQPCPTTVTRHIQPDWVDPASRTDTVLLNCAYDRSGHRFGHDYGHFLGQLARAVRALSEHAEVRYAPHMPDDERLVADLRRAHGLTLPVERLYGRSNAQIHELFARARLVIGMRGHAGMIPFGCGTPILSLVSHPKMVYFLTDIERPQWGLSVHDPHLADRLVERAGAILRDHEAAVADVHERQQRLWEITRANTATLRETMPIRP
ncbi:polysaccharide pyruvyl transferase family protein [Streptomyces sp. XM4193]|uniref:polysaccharide pyruvyl transferase family protein n=1 Tax=Streptomyces sp. XM4193 TaxID=2929782 RepID=UPI001FF9A3AD|nr:polysaccharide pyruvyl transferase family protein [Streptomyces sp. XM4193]MCK1796889.1 polysaccharide pyruvyl transferase family protein [Streptomyces sp. XM4193]